MDDFKDKLKWGLGSDVKVLENSLSIHAPNNSPPGFLHPFTLEVTNNQVDMFKIHAFYENNWAELLAG